MKLSSIIFSLLFDRIDYQPIGQKKMLGANQIIIMLKKKYWYKGSEDRRMFEKNMGVTRDSDILNELDSCEIGMMGRLAAET